MADIDPRSSSYLRLHAFWSSSVLTSSSVQQTIVLCYIGITIVINAIPHHPWAAHAEGYAEERVPSPGTESEFPLLSHWHATTRPALRGDVSLDWRPPDDVQQSPAWRTQGPHPGSSGFHWRRSDSSRLRITTAATTIISQTMLQVATDHPHSNSYTVFT